MLHRDRGRANSFGADAERYDRARPSYPAALVDELVGDKPIRVLDVGSGTGIASRLLSERGCKVLGIEPDERMAAVARGHGIEVELGAFETWEPSSRRFDLLVSAQAWHWVDPNIGSAKAASVLAAGGRIGLFWNVAIIPADLKGAIDAVYELHAPRLDDYSVLLGNAGSERFERAASSLSNSGLFSDVDMRTYGHEVSYTTEAWLDQLPTHSDHSVLDPARLDRLLRAIGAVVDGAGGHMAIHYDTWLVSAYRS